MNDFLLHISPPQWLADISHYNSIFLSLKKYNQEE